MANDEDVIELGSSEDEAAPAPKKMKTAPNTMVHIPNRLQGITIKSSKLTAPFHHQGITKKPITTHTITKSHNLVNPFHKIKSNGKPIQRLPAKPIISKELKKSIPVKTFIRPDLMKNVSVSNPLTIIKQLNNSQIKVNKIPTPLNILKSSVKIQNFKTIKGLPSSVTITKTTANLKRPAISNLTTVRKKPKSNLKGSVGEVLTVELDDDEDSQPSTAGPLWYLRPEQQTEKAELEKQNNTDPEPSKMIEITIEDSPVKPPHMKQASQIGTELAITIEDSPIKPPIAAKIAAASVYSDDENYTNTAKETKVPHSKKKLAYPKEIESVDSIEIEIEPMEFSDSNITKINKDNDNEKVTIETEIATEKLAKNLEDKDCEIHFVQDKSEFHPVYQDFIDLCFKLENSDDMKKIVEKKIKAYYKQVPKEYTESEEFIDMVSSKILSMKAGPEKMYLYIKDIVDELSLQKQMSKSNVIKGTRNAESETFLYGESSEFDSKRQRQIHKLEKTLKKLHRAIQKLEEQEVDFDDDEDSVYLLTERYKERMVRVHAKFCQLTNTKMPSEPRLQLDARPGQPKGPVKRLEKWVNKKVPIGTPLPFPDFHDVLRCVREANTEDKLGWNEADIMEEARDLFTRCGKKLQRRRQENEWRLAASRMLHDVDPAEESESLKRKLEENLQIATKKETEVLNKYADRQSQLKLEGEVIEDMEVEESPVESDDDVEECTILENKEKRKERIRRLIQEKSKKATVKVDETEEPEKDQNRQTILVDTIEIEPPTDERESEKNMDIDTVTPEDKEVNETKPKKIEKILSISDNSDQVESDIDELHLLQKLHSGNENGTSTLDSSDTDTPIDISDTLQSSSDNKGKQSSDIISIENSSYSESEPNQDTSNSKNSDLECTEDNQHADAEMEHKHYTKSLSPQSDKKMVQSNNDEYNDSIENILLASSDEEVVEDKQKSHGRDEVCLNSKDDALSVGDTVIKEVASLLIELKENYTLSNIPKNIEKSIINDDANAMEIELKENDVTSSIIENIDESTTNDDAKAMEKLDMVPAPENAEINISSLSADDRPSSIEGNTICIESENLNSVTPYYKSTDDASPKNLDHKSCDSISEILKEKNDFLFDCVMESVLNDGDTITKERTERLTNISETKINENENNVNDTEIKINNGEIKTNEGETKTIEGESNVDEIKANESETKSNDGEIKTTELKTNDGDLKINEKILTTKIELKKYEDETKLNETELERNDSEIKTNES